MTCSPKFQYANWESEQHAPKDNPVEKDYRNVEVAGMMRTLKNDIGEKN